MLEWCINKIDKMGFLATSKRLYQQDLSLFLLNFSKDYIIDTRDKLLQFVLVVNLINQDFFWLNKEARIFVFDYMTGLVILKKSLLIGLDWATCSCAFLDFEFFEFCNVKIFPMNNDIFLFQRKVGGLNFLLNVFKSFLAILHIEG